MDRNRLLKYAVTGLAVLAVAAVAVTAVLLASPGRGAAPDTSDVSAGAASDAAQESLAAVQSGHLSGMHARDSEQTSEETQISEAAETSESAESSENAQTSEAAETAQSSEAAQTASLSQPPLLTATLSANGFSFSDLSGSQLILVCASGSGATLYCYDRDANGQWTLNKSLAYLSGHVGKNGVAAAGAKTEGDGKSPFGLYDIGFAFGNSADPGTGLTYRAVEADSVWVDDSASAYYNSWQSDSAAFKDWTSAEDLSGYAQAYAYAAVIEYNMNPATPGKGSAIFLHCGTSYTAGCVSVPTDAMAAILRWLRASADPQILIVSA